MSMLPQYLKVDRINPFKVRVGWKKGTEEVTGYKVYYHCNSTGIKHSSRIITKQKYVIIEELMPGQIYVFSVVSVSNGVESEPVPADGLTIRMCKYYLPDNLKGH